MPSTDVASLRLAAMWTTALGHLHASELEDATRAARRAARAAYAESLPVQEYLAYWVLGRVRRARGNACAATRIASSLLRAAPPAWAALFEWELSLAGADPESFEATTPAAGQLRLALEGSQSAQAELRALPLPRAFAAERDALLAGLDRGVALDAARRVAAALQPAAEAMERTPAVWHLGGERPGLRWCVVPTDHRPLLFDQGERVMRAAGVLAEASVATPGAKAEGMAVPQLFERIYGFAYEPDLHDGVFRVLLHRLRDALAGAADIERDERHVRLVPRQPIALPEERTSAPFADRVLRLLASAEGTSSKELAARCGVQVRSVQRALRELVEAGVCASARRGRQIVYVAVDTTFREPTHFGAER